MKQRLSLLILIFETNRLYNMTMRGKFIRTEETVEERRGKDVITITVTSTPLHYSAKTKGEPGFPSQGLLIGQEKGRGGAPYARHHRLFGGDGMSCWIHVFLSYPHTN